MTLRARNPRVIRELERPIATLGRIGDQTTFYGKALAGTPYAVRHYTRDIVRLTAEISMGAGTLAMIGGTLVIIGFLTLATGGTLAVQGYSSLGNIGIEALTGFLAAFINVRITAPVVAGVGLAATFGAGVTAQLGAMRINQEIDALEAMAIRPISFLVSTRIVAGMIAITPLYSIAVILSFLASRFTTVFLLGQSSGLYDHYFDVPEPNRLVVVVSSGHRDGSRNPVHTYVLRLYRHGWTGRCRPCDRPRGAGIAHRRRVGHASRRTGDLRQKRQLQPVRLGGRHEGGCERTR